MPEPSSMNNEQFVGPTREPALWQRGSFMRLFAGHIVSHFATSVALVAVMAKYFEVRHTTDGWGYFVALQAAPFALLGLLAGYVADRLDRRWVVATSESARCVALLGMAHAQHLPSLCVVTFVAASANAFYVPSYRALMTELAPRDQLLQANAMEEAGRSIVGLLGVAGCGLLLSVIPVTTCLYAVAGAYFVSALSPLLLPSAPAPPARERAPTGLLEGVRLARGTPGLAQPLLLWMMLTILVGYEAPMF